MSGHTCDSGKPWDEDDENIVDEIGFGRDVPNDYAPDLFADDVGGPGATAVTTSDDPDQQIDTLLVTAKNPAGTVTATVLMNGQLVKVDLLPAVTNLTESELAEEITVISTLARQQARAVQHSFAAAMMRQLGHDPAGTRAFLEREVGLPSPQTVLDEKQRLLSARYRDNS